MIRYHLLTSSSELANIPIQIGNLIFDQEAHKIYLDGTTGRVVYEQIMYLATDDMRTTMLRNLVSGFYFVLETNILWRLDDLTWIQITEKPAQQLVYGTLGSFPRPGKAGVIYYTDTDMYHWNDITQSYQNYCNAIPQWIIEE